MKFKHYFFVFLVFFSHSAFAVDLINSKIIDLSHTYDSKTIYWPTAEGFQLEKLFAGRTKGGYYYAANNIRTAEHGGTHIDAPNHFAKGRNSVDRIPLTQLIGKAVVIDVSKKAMKNRDYQVSVQDFVDWEDENGPMPIGAIVLLRTGYGKYWPNRVKYMGTKKRGEQGVAELHFPGLDPYTAKWLTKKRKVKAIGIDTPSIDYGPSKNFQSHVNLFKSNIPAFENLANLGKLPIKNFYVIALPMKIRGGSGGPLRIVAIVAN